MSGSAVARNYAEALLELAKQSGELETYGELMAATAQAVGASQQAQAVLMNPKITKAAKAQVLANALSATGAPREFVLFLGAVVKRGRQGILGEIAGAYGDLLDEHFGRVRAQVTVARPPDAALAKTIADTLSANLAKTVVPSFQVDPDILGGAIVRVGDRVYDGSVKRRLLRLRKQLLSK